VTFLAAGALGGLVLLVPLVLAHLRRGRPPLREVSSLIIWQELAELGISAERRLRVPRLPLLLALQALALVLLVLALARPAGGADIGSGAGRVLVLDDSVWMTVPGRLAAGEQRLAAIAADAPRGTRVTVIVAAGTPYVLYRGGAAGVGRALARVKPTAAPSRLAEALSLAGALLEPGGRIALARAPEDALPALLASAGELQDELVGSPTAAQGIFSPSARCGIGSSGGCEVLATVRNTAAKAIADTYVAEGIGAAPMRGNVAVPGGGEAEIALAAPAGGRVSVRLLGHETLPAAARVSVSVPSADGLPRAMSVTLVGEQADALPVARALAAISGVKLRLRTPNDYAAADARSSAVVVLDRTLPAGTLPQSPGVLLIDPPRVPGGRVGAAMRESEVSGANPSSPLLEGIDLSSLAVDAGGARVLSLPPDVRWVAWSPEGPLLAFGQSSSQRLAVLSFDPSDSDLPQLTAFPLLVANLLRALAGGGGYQTTTTADLATQPSQIDLRVAPGNVAGGSRASFAPWLLAAALLAIALEAAYAARLRMQAMPA
jgi:hypothetical protein